MVFHFEFQHCHKSRGNKALIFQLCDRSIIRKFYTINSNDAYISPSSYLYIEEQKYWSESIYD